MLILEHPYGISDHLLVNQFLDYIRFGSKQINAVEKVKASVFRSSRLLAISQDHASFNIVSVSFAFFRSFNSALSSSFAHEIQIVQVFFFLENFQSGHILILANQLDHVLGAGGQPCSSIHKADKKALHVGCFNFVGH